MTIPSWLEDRRPPPFWKLLLAIGLLFMVAFSIVALVGCMVEVKVKVDPPTFWAPRMPESLESS